MAKDVYRIDNFHYVYIERSFNFAVKSKKTERKIKEIDTSVLYILIIIYKQI